MKSRVLDVMGEALGLVKKSDLGGATALIRKALSGEARDGSESAIRSRSAAVHRRRSPFAPPRGVRWARSCAPCAPGRSSRPARPMRPNPSRRRISANDS